MERPELERRVSSFLTNANAVVSSSIREQVDTRQVVYDWYQRRAEHETLPDLGNRVAALLARSPSELDQLRELFSKHFSAALPVAADPPKSERSVPSVAAVDTRLRWVAGAVVLLVAGLAYWRATGSQPPDGAQGAQKGAAGANSIGGAPRGQGRGKVDGSGDGAGGVPSGRSGMAGSSVVSPAVREGGPVVLSPEKQLSRTIVATDELRAEDSWCLIASFIALFLGVRFLLVVDVSAKLRKAEFEKRMRESREKRRSLTARSAARGEPEVLSYHVPRFIPLSQRELDDVATALARAYEEHAGEDLDVGETVEATVASGGRFSPAFHAARSSRTLLVLVDIENDDHPWLGGVERTLDALRLRGVLATRYRFKHRPNALFSVGGGAPSSFDDLSRRFGDSALLIISEHLDSRDFDDQPATWVGQLRSFACCAWLDPNPRPPGGNRAVRAQELAAAGLARYPFSAAGWIAAARALSGVAPTRIEPPELPAFDRGVEAAVRAWALTAALVPDATWDQLEAIRRDPAFPEIGRVLSEPHHLQLLLEWVEACTQTRAVSADGRVLYLTDRFVQQLIQDQRRSDRAGLARPLEERARELLLRQLDPERPAGEWARLRWEVKVASHRIVLDPDSAHALLASFEGSAIEELALQVIGVELERQKSGFVLRGKKRVERAREQFEKQSGVGSSVEVARLGFGMGSLHLKAFLYALALTAVVGVVFAIFASLFEGALVRGKVAVELTFPAVMTRASQGGSTAASGGTSP
ncbi:MAG: hypothetical protein EOO73_19545 [Myxococcales bacterium]|nr:MAG: hypothetical protein EOO73_19545 [Myxococcales bacterium]